MNGERDADPRRYRHTHTSTHDGSPAMLVSQDAETITLVNEDGYQWTDPRADWCPIPPGDDAVRERLDGHEWRGGYYCQCGHLLNSPSGYLSHLADVLTRADVRNLPPAADQEAHDV